MRRIRRGEDYAQIIRVIVLLARHPFLVATAARWGSPTGSPNGAVRRF